MADTTASVNRRAADPYNGVTCPRARAYIDRHGLAAYQAFYELEVARHGILEFDRRLRLALAEAPGEITRDEITLAFDPEGGTLAKRVALGMVIGPAHLRAYQYEAVPVSSLRELGAVLEEGAALGALALRARPLAPAGRCAIRDDPEKGPAGLDPAARHWAALDWEGFDLPGVAACDGPAVARALRPFMPPELAGADLIWQLTAGAGVKPDIRIRTWHWLARRLTSAELKAWLAPLFKGADPMLDPATLEAAQKIYLSVLGGPQITRWGILEGPAGDTAAAPAITLPAPRQKHVRAAGGAAGRRRTGTTHMRRLIGQCLQRIRAARGLEGQRLQVFKSEGGRAVAYARIAGMPRGRIEDLLLQAGERLYDGDSARVARNVEPLIEWWRQRDD